MWPTETIAVKTVRDDEDNKVSGDLDDITGFYFRFTSKVKKSGYNLKGYSANFLVWDTKSAKDDQPYYLVGVTNSANSVRGRLKDNKFYLWFVTKQNGAPLGSILILGEVDGDEVKGKLYVSDDGGLHQSEELEDLWEGAIVGGSLDEQRPPSDLLTFMGTFSGKKRNFFDF